MGKNHDIDIDAELARFEAAERAKLGLDELDRTGREQWRDEMTTPLFTARQRAKTTLLLGGLTMAHDYLVEGALQGIGYQTRALGCADTVSLRYGKEFGNRGQCNPTYFTVGNLVKHLDEIREAEGLTHDEVIERYAFLTAGACGPCRFGMYVTEYRKSLRDAGYDGFRVLLFQQTGGLKQATGEELGLVLNPTFFLAIGRALFAGDVINLMAYRLRPYEVEEGAVDVAIEAVKKQVYDALKGREFLGSWKAMYRGRKILEQLKLDPLRPKPKVAVIGEFWAMTTEGDGNYHLQRFLETEGAEVSIQVLVNTLLYNLWEFRYDTMQRIELRGADKSKFGLDESDPALTVAGLWLAEAALRTWWQSYAKCLGLAGHILPDMDEVATVGDDHYNVELRGGEGHLEVGKLILNVVKNKAHMTLSVKPFGCMPSSGVSDGVQSAITELYPDAIFCPVETSGDGAVNFYSRVQMYLFKARQRAREEFEAALKEHGVSVKELRQELEANPRGNLFHPEHIGAGTAADLVHAVAPYIGKSRAQRAQLKAKGAFGSVKRFATKTLPHGAGKVRQALPWMPALLRFGGEALAEKADLQTRWNTFFDKVTGPSEAEKAQIAAAEAAPAPEAKKKQSLPMASV